MVGHYERELLTLSDGGILAMLWDQGKPKPDDGDGRPILIMLGGIGSDPHACYIKKIMKEMEREMKCVFVLWRGTSGVPITSNKTYGMLSWRDIKDSVDYIHKE